MQTQTSVDSFADEFECLLERAEKENWFSRARAGQIESDSIEGKGLQSLHGTALITLAIAPARMTPLWMRYADLTLPQKHAIPADVLDILQKRPDVLASIPKERYERVIGKGVTMLPHRHHA